MKEKEKNGRRGERKQTNNNRRGEIIEHPTGVFSLSLLEESNREEEREREVGNVGVFLLRDQTHRERGREGEKEIYRSLSFSLSFSTADVPLLTV
jgi:predicted nucleotidyltransferase